MTPAQQPFIRRHERGAMMERRCDDQPVNGVVRKPAQGGGADPHGAVHRKFDESGREHSCPRHSSAVAGSSIRPLACNIAISQNDIAQTATSPWFHTRLMSALALRPSLRSSLSAHARTCVSRTIT